MSELEIEVRKFIPGATKILDFKDKMIVPDAVMVNILGKRKGQAKVTGLEKALAITGVNIHI